MMEIIPVLFKLHSQEHEWHANKPADTDVFCSFWSHPDLDRMIESYNEAHDTNWMELCFNFNEKGGLKKQPYFLFI